MNAQISNSLFTNFTCIAPWYRNKLYKKALQNAHQDLLSKVTTMQKTTLANELSHDAKYSLKTASSLIGRISHRWFLSPQVKRELQKLKSWRDSYKISSAQNLPLTPLLQQPFVRKFILQNHLHHKITKHHQTYIPLRYDLEKGFLFPVAITDPGEDPSNKKTVYVPLAKVTSVLLGKNQSSPGEIQDLEFLINGLEIHPRFFWKQLRPSYPVTIEDGHYVHIHKVTGEKERIGPVGRDYIRFMHVQEGRPYTVSWWGHSWICMILNGKRYDIGSNIRGLLLNPDFMATKCTKNVMMTRHPWVTIKETKDKYGYKIAERILPRLENLQARLQNLPLVHPEMEKRYGEKSFQTYEKLRQQKGGTCTSGAITLFEEITQQKLPVTKPSLGYRLLFNPLVRCLLNCFWSIFPKYLKDKCIRPILAVMRGHKPQNVIAEAPQKP